MELLQQEAKLLEIVKLVGMESLSNEEKLSIEIAKSIREDFLFQNAFDPEDAFTSPKKQFGILKGIMSVYEFGKDVVKQDEFDFTTFQDLKAVKKLPTLKNISDDKLDDYDKFVDDARAEIQSLKV